LFVFARHCFLFFLAAGDTASPGSSTSSSRTFLFYVFEKERCSNNSAVNREKAFEYTDLGVETQWN